MIYVELFLLMDLSQPFLSEGMPQSWLTTNTW